MPKLLYCSAVSPLFLRLMKIYFFSDILSSTKCPSCTDCANSKFVHDSFMKISVDNLRDKFHEEFMKFRETFLTKWRPIQAKRVTEMRWKAKEKERCWKKQASVLAVGSKNFFHEASLNSQSWTSASSTNGADPSNRLQPSRPIENSSCVPTGFLSRLIIWQLFTPK